MEAIAFILLTSTSVRADPDARSMASIPPAPPAMCMTKNFTVQIIASTANGAFPIPNTSRCNGKPCLDYGYLISSTTSNADHIVFSVGVTQMLLPPPDMPANVFVSPVGAGDNITGFLTLAQHEYAVRFVSPGWRPTEVHILIAGTSSPVGLSTVVLRSGGKQLESCLIAGPGSTTKDQFQPVVQTQTVLVAGGKCLAHLSFDGSGNIDITADPLVPGVPCEVGSPDDEHPLLINGEPLRNNTSPNGITFGTGTTTCYGPPIPSVPKCICTKRPCP
jgi:hypothetical protein